MKSQSPRQHAQGLHGPAPDEILELKGQVMVSFNYQLDTTKNHLRRNLKCEMVWVRLACGGYVGVEIVLIQLWDYLDEIGVGMWRVLSWFSVDQTHHGSIIS